MHGRFTVSPSSKIDHTTLTININSAKRPYSQSVLSMPQIEMSDLAPLGEGETAAMSSREQVKELIMGADENSSGDRSVRSLLLQHL